MQDFWLNVIWVVIRVNGDKEIMRQENLSIQSRAMYACMLILLVLIGLWASVTAIASDGPNVTHDILYTRGLVTDDEGNPFFAEFDENGVVTDVIGAASPGTEFENAQVISGVNYLATSANYIAFRNQYGSAIGTETQVISANDFEGLSYQDVMVQGVGGQTQAISVRIGTPFPSSKSLLILNPDQIIDPRVLGPKGVILFEAPIDCRN